MDKGERKFREKKVIQKRLKLVKNWATPKLDGTLQGGRELKEPHRLHKWNLVCSCKACRLGRKIIKKKPDKKYLLSNSKNYE